MGLLEKLFGKKRPPASEATDPHDCLRHSKKSMDDGDFAQALSWLDRAIQLDPDLQDAYLTRSLAHLAQGQPERAVSDMDLLLQKDPECAQALCYRGGFYMEMGDRDQGLLDWEAALRISPGYGLIYRNRALILAQAGQLDNAVEDFRRYSQLESNPNEVDGLRNTLVELGVSNLGTEPGHLAGAPPKPGGIYSVDNGDGTYGLAKVLLQEVGVVHVRLLEGTFNDRPAIDDTRRPFESKRTPAGLQIGHMPISDEMFRSWEPELLTVADVSPEELEGYRIWKEQDGGVFG